MHVPEVLAPLDMGTAERMSDMGDFQDSVPNQLPGVDIVVPDGHSATQMLMRLLEGIIYHTTPSNFLYILITVLVVRLILRRIRD